jgi:hypothetical protein
LQRRSAVLLDAGDPGGCRSRTIHLRPPGGGRRPPPGHPVRHLEPRRPGARLPQPLKAGRRPADRRSPALRRGAGPQQEWGRETRRRRTQDPPAGGHRRPPPASPPAVPTGASRPGSGGAAAG